MQKYTLSIGLLIVSVFAYLPASRGDNPSPAGKGRVRLRATFAETVNKDAISSAVVGACCDPEGGCEELSPAECRDELEGAYRGTGTSCPADCPLCHDPICIWCWIGTPREDDCPDGYDGDGDCDCGCQFVDVDCRGGGGRCRPDCEPDKLGDGYCDAECNYPECDFDGGDYDECAPGCRMCDIGDGACQPACNIIACDFDDGDCECAPGCLPGFPGDGVCQAACNVLECDFDGGDFEECAAGCRACDVANEHCQGACNNAACDFDGGDCGACLAGQIAWIDPPGGVVDARQPSPPGGTGDSQGILAVEVFAPSPLRECFTLCESVEATSGPNDIASVEDLGAGRVRLVLVRPMTAGAVTAITYEGMGGIARGEFYAHPANSDGDGISGTLDVLALADHLNGTASLPWGNYSCDIDHSGLCTVQDIVRAVDLLNGADEFDPWLGSPKPSADCPPNPPVPPKAPSSLDGAATDCTCVELHWQDNSENETQFRIAQVDPDEDPNNPDDWDTVRLIDNDVTSALICSLKQNECYEFKVRACNDDGCSDYSNMIVTCTTSCPLNAPSDCVATRREDILGVTITWQDNSNNETQFRVARLDPGEDPNNPRHWDNRCTVDADETSCLDTRELTPGARYYYKVRAALEGDDETVYSDYSNKDDAIPRLPSIAAPSNCVATRREDILGVTITWQDNSNNESQFRVARLDPGEDPNNPDAWDNRCVVGPNQTSCLDEANLQPGARYRYKVRAVLLGPDENFYSDYSNIDDAIPRPPSIAAPSNCVATRREDILGVTITWQDNSNNESRFRVARLDPGEAPNNPDAWDNECVVGANQASCLDVANLQPGARYCYKVRAALLGPDEDFYSDYSNIECAIPRLPLRAPSNLSATHVLGCLADLHWADNSTNEGGFRIARLDPGEDPNNPNHWDNVGETSTNDTAFRARGLALGTCYQFKVRAFDGNDYSEYSNAISVCTLSTECNVPAAPFNCVAARQGSTPQPDPILITWSYSGLPASGFRVARLDPGENPDNPSLWGNVGGDLPPSQLSYVDNSPGRLHGQTYNYKVRAFIECECGRTFGEYSNIDPANP